MSTLQDNPARPLPASAPHAVPGDAFGRTVRKGLPLLPAALALAASLYLPIHWSVGRWTDLDSPQSYQPLVPLGAAWLAWQRREQVQQAWKGGDGARAGGVGNVSLLLTGGVFLLAAHVFQLGLLGIAGGAVMLAGAVLCIWGWAVLRALAVPLAFLLLTAPLPNSVLGPATQSLQMDCTRAAGNVLGNLGVPCRVAGNMIFLRNFQLEVIAPCAGVGMVAPVLALTLWRLLARTHEGFAANSGSPSTGPQSPAIRAGSSPQFLAIGAGSRGGGGLAGRLIDLSRAAIILAVAGAIALGFNVLRITSVGLIGSVSPSLARTLHDLVGWLWTAAAFGVAFLLTRLRGEKR